MTRRSPRSHASPPGHPLRFVPSSASDLALAVGLSGAPDGSSRSRSTRSISATARWPRTSRSSALPPDRLSRFTRSVPVEVIVDGVACFSGPATTVVVAVGQFLRGADLVPRGHPGDGRAEVQVYAVAGRDRRRLRARLRSGDHVPHPEITQRIGSSDRDQQRPAAGVGGRRRGPLARQLPDLRGPFRRGTAWCSSPPRRRGAASLPSLFPCCTRRSRSAKRKPPPSGRISRTSTVPCSR